MLQDGELDGLEARLNAYRIENARANFSLEELLSRYEKLIDEYKTLKDLHRDDHGGARSSLGVSQGHDGNPFVLVLIDGNHMIFNDDLIKARQEGGIRAANLLLGAVRSCLAGTGLESATIVLRVYADLAGLSRNLSKAHLVGPERRSLAPFTAAFSSTRELFDFIDAGEDAISTKGKIKESLRLFADSRQCKHILFAGCCDIDYLQMLMPYRNNPNRITLIRSPNDIPQFSKLGLRFESFSSCFRMTSIETTIANDDAPPGLLSKHTSSQSTTSTWGPAPSHPRQDRKPEPFRASAPFRPPVKHSSHPPGHTFFAPKQEHAGKIPVNEHGQRLDSFLPKPSGEDWNNFSARCASRKMCNDQHLRGTCPRGDACPYDHNPAAPELINVLRSVARSMPCPRRGDCRDSACYMGHVCTKPSCAGPGRGCRLSKAMHGVDARLAAWVAGDADGDGGAPPFDSGTASALPSPSLARSPDTSGVGLERFSSSTPSDAGQHTSGRWDQWDGAGDSHAGEWTDASTEQDNSWDAGTPSAHQNVKW